MTDDAISAGGRACRCGRPLRPAEKRCPSCAELRAAKIKRVLAATGSAATFVASTAIWVVTKGRVKLR